MPRRLIILGATGSIGRNAIDVGRSNRDEFDVVAVSALNSREECEALAKDNLSPTIICESAGTMAEDALAIKTAYLNALK